MENFLSYSDFAKKLDEMGFLVPNNQTLTQFYLFYKFYNSSLNEGVSSIVLEGVTGTGKTFFSEAFKKILGEDTMLMYRQCIDETGKEEMFMDYDPKAILLGDADKIVVDGILIEAIKAANNGKKVVLMIDELDKAKPRLDGYFLDFLRSGRVVVSGKEIYKLTEDGRKNLYFIIGKNDQRELSKELLRRGKYVILEPLPPIKIQEHIKRKFKDIHHDTKFATLVIKIYSMLYKAYYEGKIERPPAIQEIVQSIDSDVELFDNHLSTTERLRNMILELIKNNEDRDFLENLLVEHFKYKKSESAYEDDNIKEEPEIQTGNINDFLNRAESDNSEPETIGGKIVDRLEEIGDVLDTIVNNDRLFLSYSNGNNEIQEVGRIMCDNENTTFNLFNIIRNESDPSSKIGILYNEGNIFIGVAFVNNTISIIANTDKLSPTLLAGAFIKLYAIVNPERDLEGMNRLIKTGLHKDHVYIRYFNAQVLSRLPDVLINMCDEKDGNYYLESENIRMDFDLEDIEDKHIKYKQNHEKVEVASFIEELLLSNPELGMLASSIASEGNSFEGSNDQYQRSIQDFKPKEIVDFCTSIVGKYDIYDFFNNIKWDRKILSPFSIQLAGNCLGLENSLFGKNRYLMKNHGKMFEYYSPMMHSKATQKIRVRV